MSTIIQHTPEEIHSWLLEQAQARNVIARFGVDQAHLEHGLMEMAVHFETDLDICGRAQTLQDIEDSWNDQDPRPSPQLLLLPRTTRRWQSQGIWHDAHEALIKQKHAIELYDIAEDKEAIAAEFWSAREDYEASLKELEMVMPRNGHTG